MTENIKNIKMCLHCGEKYDIEKAKKKVVGFAEYVWCPKCGERGLKVKT